MKDLFIYKGTDWNVETAVKLANKMFPSIIKELKRLDRKVMSGKKNVYNKIAGKYFTTTNLAHVIETLVIYKSIQMEVKTYYQNNGAIGYFIGSRPNDINLNRKFFPREVWEIVATLYHELIHKIDKLSKTDLSHGKGWRRNKWKPWKEKCAPYLVDGIVEPMAVVASGNSDITDVINLPRTDNSKYVSVPWYKKWLWWKYK